MADMRPLDEMRTFTGSAPARSVAATYMVRSGFMPSGRRVNSTQSLTPGRSPLDTSLRMYTMPPMRRAWQWVVSDSQRFTQPVSSFNWDTEYQPMGQHIEHIQYELDMGPCALMRPFG